MKNLIFAFNIMSICKIKCNSACQTKQLVGIGSGQPSRLDSCQIAIDKMKKFMKSNDES